MKTIRLLFFSFFLIFATQAVQAQSFDGGLMAGAVTSQINGDGYGGFHQLGCTGGVFARVPTDGPFSWQLEIKYTLLGAHSDVDELQNALPMNIRLHYVELPVMGRYNLSKININGTSLDFITLEAGLSGDFLISGRQSADMEELFENSQWLFFSVTGNLGVQFDLNEHWGVNLRSMNSVTPCRWRPESPSIFYGHYYNIALAASVTYTIHHWGK